MTFADAVYIFPFEKNFSFSFARAKLGGLRFPQLV